MLGKMQPHLPEQLLLFLFPHVMVLSLNEIPNDVQIRTEGVVAL